MTENGGAEQGISRAEALAIAEKKLRAKRVTVVAKPTEGEVVRVRKEPGVAQLMAAHYEKLVAGLEEGSKTQTVARQMERFVYDAAKASGVVMGVADFALGGMLLWKAGKDIRPLRPLRTAPHGWAVAELLGAVGAWRYAPATMVARTALNMTL